MENTLRYITDKTAVLIITPENRRYLTGFPSSLGYLLMTREGNTLFVDGRYFEAAEKKTSQAKVVLLRNIYAQLGEELKKCGASRLLIETEVSYRAYSGLKANLGITVTPYEKLSEKLLQLRSVKKKEETDSIISAQRIAEKAFDEILNFIKVGVSERQIANELEYKMKQYGAEGIAFETIAVSGVNSSLPHGVPTDKKVEEGEFITMDFGAVINGYCSDMTRTVAVGFATDEMQKVYNAVLAAQESAIEKIKAGSICRDIDFAARSVIDGEGYGDFFTHSTGHGVGLMIHEYPNLSPKSEVKLRAGQIVTAEPGIYLPGRFGVRTEDMLQVRKNGVKNLTKAPKHLIIL